MQHVRCARSFGEKCWHDDGPCNGSGFCLLSALPVESGLSKMFWHSASGELAGDRCRLKLATVSQAPAHQRRYKLRAPGLPHGAPSGGDCGEGLGSQRAGLGNGFLTRTSIAG